MYQRYWAIIVYCPPLPASPASERFVEEYEDYIAQQVVWGRLGSGRFNRLPEEGATMFGVCVNRWDTAEWVDKCLDLLGSD